MTWFLKLPDGTRHDIEDLPMAAYVEVETETGQPWYEVCGNPYRNAKGAVALLRHVLPGLGVDFPGELTAKQFPTWFEWSEEDTLPTGGTTALTAVESESPPEVDAA